MSQGSELSGNRILGKSKNRFTFQILTTLLKSAGDYHFVISWHGEKIPKGEMILHQSKHQAFNGLEAASSGKKASLHPKTKKMIFNFLKNARRLK